MYYLKANDHVIPENKIKVALDTKFPDKEKQIQDSIKKI